MEEYYCKPCKYHTNKTSTFKKHVASAKHICIAGDEQCEIQRRKIYCCDECDNVYTSNQSLNNHKKIHCDEKINAEIHKKDLEIQELKQELKSKDVQLHKALDVAVENSKTANTSMNILKYAKLYLNDVEPLEQLEKEDVFDVINYKNPKNTEIKNEDYVKIVIHKFNHGIFAYFIGDMIIEHFKPKNNNETNVIATDTSRLCFIIMQKVNIKGKIGQKEWINDKSGKRFTVLVLQPIISAIKEILVDFLAFKKSKNLSENLLCLMAKCVELKRDIEVEKFTKSILRHVAPSFHFDNLKIVDNDFCDSDNSDDSGDLDDLEGKVSKKIIKKKVKKGNKK